MSAPSYTYEEKTGPESILATDGPTSSTRDLNAYAGAEKDVGTYSSYPSSPSSSPSSPTSAAAAHAGAVSNIFSQLDNHALSWFHLKTVVVAGMGFFCDSYDLFSISLVTKTLGRIYYPDTSYNCYPQANPTSLTSITPFSAHCVAILSNLGIATAATGSGATLVPGFFNAGYDATGRGWADQENNDIQGNGVADGDHNLWNRILSHRPSALPTNTNYALSAVALCGTLAGQLLFGYLGDRFGRRQVFGITLYIMVTACAAQAFSFGSSATSVIASLCFFRFCLGMGVGGDYPLSATLMSEYASKHNRGAMVAAVFAMQGIGYLFASAVAIIFSAIWMRAQDTANPDHLWRLILSFGCIPTAATIYARLSLPETPRYTMFVSQNATQLVEDMNFVLAAERARASGGGGGEVPLPASIAGRPAGVAAPPPVLLQARRTKYSEFFAKYWLTLVGTASCWFLLDVAFYSQNLTQGNVFSAIGWLPPAVSMTIQREAYFTARAQAIVALSSTVPGYWCTVATIEYMGRRNIQFMGFFFMTLFMAILAGDYTNLSTHHTSSFVAVYCLTFFFANWGPNSTTFILPAEVYPTQFRTLGHGMSAAAGKAGAIIGTFGFVYMSANVSLQSALGLLAGCNGLGFFCTFLVPETKGKTLEEISGDAVAPSQVVPEKEMGPTKKLAV